MPCAALATCRSTPSLDNHGHTSWRVYCDELQRHPDILQCAHLYITFMCGSAEAAGLTLSVG